MNAQTYDVSARIYTYTESCLFSFEMEYYRYQKIFTYEAVCTGCVSSRTSVTTSIMPTLLFALVSMCPQPLSAAKLSMSSTTNRILSMYHGAGGVHRLRTRFKRLLNDDLPFSNGGWMSFLLPTIITGNEGIFCSQYSTYLKDLASMVE